MINNEKSLLRPINRIVKKMNLVEFKKLMYDEINRLGGFINYVKPKPSEEYIYLKSFLDGLSNNGL